MLYPGDQHSLDVELLYHGVRFDPATSLTLVLTLPDLTTLTYVYGTDPEITKNAIGLYTADFTIPAAGTSVGLWTYEWTAIDPEATVTVDGTFEVIDDVDSVTITVEDQDTNPVVGAYVEARNSAGKIVWGGSTLNTGQLVMQLTDGDYTAHVEKAGFSFVNPYSFTVAGVTAPAAFSGTDLSITTAPTLALCRLYGFLRRSNGTASPRATVFVTEVGEGRTSLVGTGATGVNTENVGISNYRASIPPRKSDGYWEVDLVQGTVVELKIPAIGYQTIFRVPAQETLNFGDVRPDPSPKRGNQKGTPQNF